MADLSQVIAPKSDQLNADDLIAGPITITIARVTVTLGAEQPTAVHFEGDAGKPYKPCKSMSRVLVAAWGKDGTRYAGRQLTLYRDPTVLFGGVAVGGIRISHMSHIDGEKTIALTVTRAKRKPYTVRPLGMSPKQTWESETRAADRPPAAARSEGADVPHPSRSAPSPAFPGDYVTFREWRFDPNEPEPIPEWGDDLKGLASTLAACIKGAGTQDARTRWLTYNSAALADLTQAAPKTAARLRELAQPNSAAPVPLAADEGAPVADGSGATGAPSPYGATG